MAVLGAAAHGGNPPPRAPVPICQGRKFPPDPSTGPPLLPEHGSKTCHPVPWADPAPEDTSTAQALPSRTCRHLRGFPAWQNIAELMGLGGEMSFPVPTDHWVPQSFMRGSKRL